MKCPEWYLQPLKMTRARALLHYDAERSVQVLLMCGNGSPTCERLPVDTNPFAYAVDVRPWRCR